MQIADGGTLHPQSTMLKRASVDLNCDSASRDISKKSLSFSTIHDTMPYNIFYIDMEDIEISSHH